jgi:hypothetical protein
MLNRPSTRSRISSINCPSGTRSLRMSLALMLYHGLGAGMELNIEPALLDGLEHEGTHGIQRCSGGDDALGFLLLAEIGLALVIRVLGSLVARRTMALVVVKIGLHEAGAEHGHLDVVPVLLDVVVNAFAQRHGKMLGGEIRRHVAHGEQARQRGHVDDVAGGALLFHYGDDAFHGVDLAEVVHVDYPLPVPGRKLGDLAADGDSGIVDEKIDLSVDLHGLVHHLLDLVLQGYVHGDGLGHAAVIPHPFRGALHIGLVYIRQHQLHAAPAGLLRKFLAEAVSGAGYQSYLAIKFFHLPLPSFKNKTNIAQA